MLARSENTIVLLDAYSDMYTVIAVNGDKIYKTKNRDRAVREAKKYHKSINRTGNIVVRLVGRVGVPKIPDWLAEVKPNANPAKVLKGFLVKFNMSAFDFANKAGLDQGVAKDILAGKKEILYPEAVQLGKFFNTPWTIWTSMQFDWRKFKREHPEQVEEEV